MSTSSEGQFTVGDATFYSKTWTPDGHVKAKLVFVHGFSEHINRYNVFFPKLAEKGIQVFAWDQRGWGRSVSKPSQKGLTGPTSQVIADVAAFVKDKLTSKEETTSAPLFVMGHSMGGGEVLTLAGDASYTDLVKQVRGWILECPFVGFPAGEEPSSIKIFAGRLVSRLLPKQQMKHVVPPEHLSRDQAVVESVKEDPLCHNTGTLEGLASLLDRTALLASGGVKLSKNVQSVLLTHGSVDRACSYDAAVKFLENQGDVQDKTTKTYEGAYHQLHADHCKEEFTKDVVGWILERSGRPEGSEEPVGAKL